MSALRGRTRLLLLIAVIALAQCVSISKNTEDIHHGLQKKAKNPHERLLVVGKDNIAPPAERDTSFWLNVARDELRERVARENLNKKRAKNVIMFLGDGMSLTTVTAARILKGQREGRTGEESKLNFEKFPYTGFSRTYCANAQVADSACSATAYLCGVKTNFLQLGVNAHVDFNDCAAAMNPANQVSSIAAWAQAAGKSTGFVTTTTLTHASPGGSYAHIPNRFMESDNDISLFSNEDPTKCMDIAQQLVTQAPGRYFDVMMGGGMGKFLPNTTIDLHGNAGERRDGRNLLSQFQGRHPKGRIVTTLDEMERLNVSRVTNIMGLFESKYMKFHLEANPRKQPTLAQMTRVTLNKLKQNKNGFFAFIEGGLIDSANHLNMAGLSLDETLEFDKAVQVAYDMTSDEDTLIVVTADHGHPLTISGYPDRGNDILNLNEATPDKNGRKYPTLSYSAGMEQYLNDKGQCEDLTGRMGDSDFIFPSYIPADLGVHSGEDVGIHASGPFAHLFSGTLQQNTIPHAMAYAACIGDGPTMCDAGN